MKIWKTTPQNIVNLFHEKLLKQEVEFNTCSNNLLDALSQLSCPCLTKKNKLIPQITMQNNSWWNVHTKL